MSGQSITNSNLSLAEQFLLLPIEERERRFGLLTPEEIEAILYDWEYWCRPSQQMPPHDIVQGGWTTWLVLAGRGFGKTRIGAETVRRWVKDYPIVNLIGATADDARDIMIEGESGILAICPKAERPAYLSSKRRLEWPNGAISLIFTADEPERLRGKQHYKLWGDELASWRYEESWDQAQFGLRLGNNPQAVVTTTPKPTRLVRDLVRDPNTVVTRGSTYENRSNLAASFYTKIINKYEGTRLGRQELKAELLEDNPGALWKMKQIEETRVTKAPELKRIVVAIDPAMSANDDSDLTGIVVAGVDSQWPPHYYVLADLSIQGTPEEWTKIAVRAYHDFKADRVVAEANNGGDMIEAVLRTKALELAYRAVHASRGKITRAEPISALYEQKRVHHVGIFGALESEMTDYNPATSTKSPDRMDALVWAITELSGAAASGTVFRNFWTPDLIYSDATRPPSLGNAGGFVAKYVLITYGTNNTTYFTEVIDDGAVLWFDREYAWDAVREAKHRTNAEQVEELQQFIQDTRKTELLLSSSALSLQGELTKRGLWFTEVESSEEDLVEGIRIASSMMSRQLFRVHHRCLHLLSQIGTYSWDQRKLANGAEVPLKGDDFAVAPAMILVKNKIPMWRLSS